MAPVKLTYFDIRGYAEPIRQIMIYGGIEFEDNRVPYSGPPAHLPQEIKSKCRWGQVPLAEFDGKTLVQSTAIARYFAKKANLVPADEYKAALCNEYVDALKDLNTSMWPVIMIQDPAEKKAKLEEALKVAKSKFLDVFESIIKKNDGKHLLGNTLTWADIYLAEAMDNFKIILNVDLTEGYPNLKNLKDTVQNTPKIKAWLEKRPKTMF